MNNENINEINSKNGRFRKKRVYFSVVSNTALRDPNLSLKAKGLYGLIQSYITLENFTLYKATLYKDCKEGEVAFDSAWKELKQTGYLKQFKCVGENNKFYYEYELLEQPDTSTPSMLTIKKDGTPIEEKRKNLVQKDHTHKIGGVAQNEEKSHTYKIKGVGSLPTENHPDIIIHDTNNTNINNTNINQSILSYEETTKKQSAQEMMDEIETYTEIVKENIDYDALTQSNTDNVEEINEIVDIMVDVITTQNDTVSIGGRIYPREIIKSKFLKLTSEHINYVLYSLTNNTSRIKNIKGYLITTLHNAYHTITHYYNAHVNHMLSNA